MEVSLVDYMCVWLGLGFELDIRFGRMTSCVFVRVFFFIEFIHHDYFCDPHTNLTAQIQ